MLASASYTEQNKKLHENPLYGASTATKHYWPLVEQAIVVTESKSILDYGCGKGVFKITHPDMNIYEYDPSIEGKNVDPKPCEFLMCLDVMEHIEPECLDSVLSHMQSKTGKAAFISVSTRPAKKTLPDGRNAHLIQEPAEWWFTKINQYFRIIQFAGDKNGFWVLCAADKS